MLEESGHSGVEAMGERGEHVVSAADRKGCPLWLIGAVLAFISLIALCSQPEGAPAPREPSSRAAIFSSADANVPQFAFTMGGGNYSLVYESIDSLARLQSEFAGEGVFVADFRRGTSEGNLATARTILVIGNANVWVGDVAGRDLLLARFRVEQGRVRTASFDYLRGGTGGTPLAWNVAKRIVVLGRLNPSLGLGHGNSERLIEINERSTPSALQSGYLPGEYAIRLEPDAATMNDYYRERNEWMRERAAEGAAKAANDKQWSGF